MSNLSVLLKGKIGKLILNFEHHFKSNGITILYGPNGSGKTTIISALGGFINNIETKIIFNGKELHDTDKYPPNKTDKFKSINLRIEEATHLLLETR